MKRGKNDESNNKKEQIAAARTPRAKSNTAKKKSDAAGSKKSKRLQEVEQPEKLALIEGWVRDGVIEKDIAKFLGCSYSTLREWKKISSALSAALKKNRECADYYVENSLFRKACGHKETVQKPIKLKRVEYDSETGKRICEYEEIVYAYEEVYIPPDTLADIFWLKNRKPEQWKDKVEQSVDLGIEEGGVLMLAPVLESNEPPTETPTEDNMAATT